MATITLFANKINDLPELVRNARSSVDTFKEDLSSLITSALKVDGDVCSLEDTISSLRSSTDTQEDKSSVVGNIADDIERFSSEVVSVDDDVAEVITSSKDDFYDTYDYLTPECEQEEKSWWEKFKDGLKAVGEWCKEHWKDLVKIAVAVVIVIALTIATIATGGAAGGVLGFILAGALKGAIIGGITSAIMGAGISAVKHRITTGSWEGIGNAMFSGMADGLLSGVILGGIAGAAGNALKVFQAGRMWNPGTFKSGYQSMKYHYGKHVINEGFAKGNNIVKYTKDALDFSYRNSSLLKYTYNYKHGNAVWRLVFDAGNGGTFDSLGRIVQFWYESI